MGKKRLKARKEARKQGLAGSLVRPIGNQHPVLVQAISNGARLDRADYEVAHVPNPYGEVIVRGELRRHAGVRRVPRFETLHRTKGISDDVLACLVWYAARLAAAQAGMVRCGLDVSGTGGGSAFHHIPVQQAAMEARSDVDWARGFIPGGELLAVFDRVMGNLESEGDEGFEAIARVVYPAVSVDWGRRRASTAFKLAANYLSMGAGPRVLAGARAA